jgi:hypothetical protein
MRTSRLAAILARLAIAMLVGAGAMPFSLQPTTRLLAEEATDAVHSIVINEIFAHSNHSDAVELHNIGDAAVDISGWLLTDNTTRAVRDWARLPDGVILPPGGYYVSWEKDPRVGDWSFALSEAGETIYLLRPDPAGGFPLLVESVRFGASPNGVSFIRYVDSIGRVHYPLQSGATTLGAPNRGPRLSAVVIEEIMHHPLSGEAEYVVIANITSLYINLYDSQPPFSGWKFVGQNQNGLEHDMFVFPPSMTLAPHERIILSEVTPQELRQRLSIPLEVRVFQWERGGLSNSGERIALMQPQPVEADGKTVYYVVVDEVEYNYDPANGAVWPDASGNGRALGRVEGWAFANDVLNWRSVSPPMRTVAPRIYLPFVSGWE